MPINWRLYGARIHADTLTDGVTPRDENVARLKSDIRILLPSNPAYKSVEARGPEDDAWREMDLAVISSDDLTLKYLRTMPGDTIKAGEIVRFADAYWLVTDEDSDSEIYQKAVMQRCNYILKFRDDTGTAVERYCVIVSNLRYQMGEHTRDMLTVGNTHLQLFVSKDSKTRQISRKTRFIVDDIDAHEKLTFEVTMPDRVTGIINGHGIYKFMVQETPAEDGDDMALMVPDNSEYEPNDPSTGRWY
ncbi:MAG: hypothetical protein LBD92_07305 [Oscillospiraceae bacterium]|nr:hypothetical protein [Oscillospiraceae bacterium]